MGETEINYLRFFRPPSAAGIAARTSAITNSFAGAIIPAIMPTSEDVRVALSILGMNEQVECAYCGDTSSEWDHLRPLVLNKRPTGYITEIHNLVPACGKCNQSKGNRYWRTWMFGPAALSPATRSVADIDQRAKRLEAYEAWLPPTQVNFEALVGSEVWAEYWRHHERVEELLRIAQSHAVLVRERVRDTYLNPSHG